MMRYRLLAVVLLGALLSVTGCSEPTSVGANIGPDSLQGGAPLTQEVAPTSLQSTTEPTLTGIDASAPGGSRAWRFLTGTVLDPIGGELRATGYLDFSGSQEPAQSIQTALSSGLDAELRLLPTYVHGDTSSTVNVTLYALASEAEMSRAPSDTSFAEEPQELGTYTISPNDSLVTLPLPTSWIDEHLSALKDSAAFGDKINGFKFVSTDQASSANRQVVVGFELSSAALRLSSTSDTTDFRALKAFTEIERLSGPNIPPNTRLLQDGLGTGVTFEWNFDEPPLDSLRNAALNNAAVTVPLDTAQMRASLSGTTADFTRPLPNGYRIIGTLREDRPDCGQLGLFPLPEDNRSCTLPTVSAWAPEAARLESNTAFQIFQQAFVDTPVFRRYRVEITMRESSGTQTQGTLQRGLPSTLPALIPTLDSPVEERPRATLTVTPL